MSSVEEFLISLGTFCQDSLVQNAIRSTQKSTNSTLNVLSSLQQSPFSAVLRIVAARYGKPLQKDFNANI